MGGDSPRSSNCSHLCGVKWPVLGGGLEGDRRSGEDRKTKRKESESERESRQLDTIHSNICGLLYDRQDSGSVQWTIHSKVTTLDALAAFPRLSINACLHASQEISNLTVVISYLPPWDQTLHQSKVAPFVPS